MSNKDIEEDIKIANSIVKVNNDYLKDIEKQTINQREIQAIENILADREKRIEDIQRLQETLDKSDANNVKLEKEVKKFKNMYEAEHRIHLVRNEQLARKERAVLKANKYDNLISEIKSEIEAIKDKRSKLGFKTYLKREDMIREDSILLGEQKVLQKLLKTIEGEKK